MRTNVHVWCNTIYTYIHRDIGKTISAHFVMIKPVERCKQPSACIVCTQARGARVGRRQCWEGEVLYARGLVMANTLKVGDWTPRKLLWFNATAKLLAIFCMQAGVCVCGIYIYMRTFSGLHLWRYASSQILWEKFTIFTEMRWKIIHHIITFKSSP